MARVSAVAIVAQVHTRGDPNQPSGLVSTQTLSSFFQWAAERRPTEVVDVWKRATRVFRQGCVIEDYPEALARRLPRQSPVPLVLIALQFCGSSWET